MFEYLIMLLIGVLGFSLGTIVSLKNKSSLNPNETINHSLLEERVKNLEERLQVIEDYIQSTIKGNEREQPREEGNNNGVDWELVNLRIITLYKNGYSIRQIARELGLSKSSVHRRLRRMLGKAGA